MPWGCSLAQRNRYEPGHEDQVNQRGSGVASRYAARAKTALHQFRAEIRKDGTPGSTRTSTLYVPAAPILTQDTDSGPP